MAELIDLILPLDSEGLIDDTAVLGLDLLLE